MDVADAGVNLVFQVNGRMRNLVAHQVEGQRLGLALAIHGHLHVGAFGAFQRLGHHVRCHAFGRLAVHCGDDVAGMDASPVRGRVLVGRNHVNFVVLLLDDHAHAVVAAVLLLAHPGKGLGIVEVRVRVQHPQHPWDGSVVDGQVGLFTVDRLGVVLLHLRIDAGERLEAIAQLALALRALGPHTGL